MRHEKEIQLPLSIKTTHRSDYTLSPHGYKREPYLSFWPPRQTGTEHVGITSSLISSAPHGDLDSVRALVGGMTAGRLYLPALIEDAQRNGVNWHRTAHSPRQKARLDKGMPLAEVRDMRRRGSIARADSQRDSVSAKLCGYTIALTPTTLRLICNKTTRVTK